MGIGLPGQRVNCHVCHLDGLWAQELLNILHSLWSSCLSHAFRLYFCAAGLFLCLGDFNIFHKKCIQEVGMCAYIYIQTETHTHLSVYLSIYQNTGKQLDTTQNSSIYFTLWVLNPCMLLVVLSHYSLNDSNSVSDCLQRRQKINVHLKAIRPSKRIERLFAFQLALSHLFPAFSISEMLTDFIASLES